MLTPEERKKAINLAQYVHCSPHEWPQGADLQLVCLALLEANEQLYKAKGALFLAPSGDDYRIMAISLSGQALKPDMQKHIASYETALKEAIAALVKVEREPSTVEKLCGPLCRTCGVPEKQCDCLPQEKGKKVMNVRTCYRCPERHPDPLNRRKRCPVLQEKLNAVRGAGLTNIEFKCEKRKQLFKPGEVVRFTLTKGENPLHGGTIEAQAEGIIMKADGRRYLLYSEDTNFCLARLYPDSLHRTGERVRVCIHCAKPEGVTIQLPHKNSEESAQWVCRYSTDFDTSIGGYQALPCEYAEVNS